MLRQRYYAAAADPLNSRVYDGQQGAKAEQA